MKTAKKVESNLNALKFALSQERKTEKYQINALIQQSLSSINEALQTQENEYINSISDHSHIPVVMISYVPRSGSTLLLQLLAKTRKFNYISNLNARFWSAPYLGSFFEKSLYDKFQQPISFQSDYGLTKMAWEPCEFSYFWKNWLFAENPQSHTLEDSSLSNINFPDLVKHVNALRSSSEKPLMFKKEWLGMNAGPLSANIPNLRFIHINRDPLDIAASVLKARKNVYGNLEQWWAAKPSNYTNIKLANPYEQIVYQINGILKDIRKWQIKAPQKFLNLKYEELIQDVHGNLDKVFEFMDMDFDTTSWEDIPEKFEKKSTYDISEDELNKLKMALQESKGKQLA